MIESFRKRPVVIEAAQLAASEDGRVGIEIAKWCGGSIGGTFANPYIMIHTLEGVVRASVGDWIVCGVKGEFYPVRSDIFEATYEKAAEAAERS